MGWVKYLKNQVQKSNYFEWCVKKKMPSSLQKQQKSEQSLRNVEPELSIAENNMDYS